MVVKDNRNMIRNITPELSNNHLKGFLNFLIMLGSVLINAKIIRFNRIWLRDNGGILFLSFLRVVWSVNISLGEVKNGKDITSSSTTGKP